MVHHNLGRSMAVSKKRGWLTENGFCLLFAVSLMTGSGRSRADETVGKQNEEGPFQELKYRSIGPATGGRVCRVAGVAGKSAHLLRGDGLRRCLAIARRRAVVEMRD